MKEWVKKEEDIILYNNQIFSVKRLMMATINDVIDDRGMDYVIEKFRWIY